MNFPKETVDVKEYFSKEKEWKLKHPFLYTIREIYYEIFYRFPNNISLSIKEIKWFFQRGARGYSDCDVWNFHDYHSTICKNALLKLKKIANGYPASLSNDKAWKDILEKMIFAFEQAEQISAIDIIVWYPERPIDNLMQDAKYQTKEDYDKMQEGFKLFFEWYWNLWD